MKNNIAYLLILLLSVSSCIYPFTPEYPESDRRIVIEGDVLIGEQTSVRVSYLANLDGTTGSGPVAPLGSVWVEASNGTRYDGISTGDRWNATFSVDTRQADPSLRYKLHFKDSRTAKEYSSVWLDVVSAGVIDSLYVGLDEPLSMVRFYMDFKGGEQTRYFRINFSEDWEYHSQCNSELLYIPPENRRAGNGEIIQNEGTRYYYCWDKDNSTSIMLASTERLSSNVLKAHEYHSLPRTSRKISSVYSEEVHVAGITKDAYDYWNNINTGSNNTGSLFAPMPSDMPGNIVCLSDSTEHVIGYISATKRAVKRMFYYNATYYIDAREPMTVRDTLPEKEWFSYYQNGNLPAYYVEDLKGYTWAPARCVDCRVEGGTKEKPSWWPTVNE